MYRKKINYPTEPGPYKGIALDDYIEKVMNEENSICTNHELIEQMRDCLLHPDEQLDECLKAAIRTFGRENVLALIDLIEREIARASRECLELKRRFYLICQENGRSGYAEI